MLLQQSSPVEEQSQRIQVEMEIRPDGRFVKISIEHFDQRLGWYPSGSLSLPLHQLPLLEQAIADMRDQDFSDESLSDKILPFLHLARGA